ncbi:MAG: hypothetical protein Q9169_000435 [Polycauliona sp. 2 TL-2023]
MAGPKRSPQTQDSNESRKKRTRIDLPSPADSSPPAPCNPSQWAESRNVSIDDYFRALTVFPNQPNRRTTSPETSSDIILLANSSPTVPKFQPPSSPIPFSDQQPPWRIAPPKAPLSFLRYSERPMRKNENDLTMLKIIDKLLIPGYLERHPECPDNGAKRKNRYIRTMTFNRLKLLSRVEKWRIHVSSEDDDEELRRRRERNKRDLPENLQCPIHERKLRDRTNLTDYVNGRMEAVCRGKLMCWPCLIPMHEFDSWAEHDLKTLRRKQEPGIKLEADLDWDEFDTLPRKQQPRPGIKLEADMKWDDSSTLLRKKEPRIKLEADIEWDSWTG